MGYRTTMRLTRERAEAEHLEMHVELQRKERREKLERRAAETPGIDVPYAIRDRNPDLTTEDVVSIWIDVDLETRAGRMRRRAVADLAVLKDDADLENELERLHDRIRDGHGHENYNIAVGDDE